MFSPLRFPESGVSHNQVFEARTQFKMVMRWRYRGTTEFEGRKALYFQIGGVWPYNFRNVATADSSIAGYGLIDAATGAMLYQETLAQRSLIIGHHNPGYQELFFSYRVRMR